MTDKIVVTTTCGSLEEAHRIARQLVEQRLAACAQVGSPIQSFYHWKGELEDSTEYPVAIKTRRDLYDALCRELRRLHSYQVPEILSTAIVDGSPEYLAWMDHELRAS